MSQKHVSVALFYVLAAAPSGCTDTATGGAADATTVDTGASNPPPPCATPEELAALGGTIVYEGDPPDGPDPALGFEVFVIGAPDWQPRHIAGGPDFDGHPSWSPDGSRIVYQSNAAGNADLFLVDPDGTRLEALAASDGDEVYPHWLSEGIVYRRGLQHRLIDLDTGERAPFLALGPDIDRFTFSPDRSQTVVSKGFFRTWHLFLAEPDGTIIEQLTDDCDMEAHPSWAPNGSRVSYSCKQRDAWDVRIIDVDTREISVVTTQPGEDWNGGWAANGERVLVASAYDGNWDIYAIRPDGTERLRVTCHAGAARYPSWTAAEPQS